MQIVTAQRQSFELLAQVLSEAMYEDPMYYDVFSDRKRSYRYFSLFWKAILEYTSQFGVVLTTQDCIGAVCLLSPDKTDFTVKRLWQTRFAVPRSVLRFPLPQMVKTMDILMRLGDIQNEILPEPHWYLMEIGVKPQEQGKGVGGNLLREVLRIVNESGDDRPIYLETETEKNVQIYHKYGFSVVKEIDLVKHGLHYYIMVRDSNGKDHATTSC